MTDYSKLHQKLAREILKREGKIADETASFVNEFIDSLRAKGWKISDDERNMMTSWLDSLRSSLAEGIATAVSMGAGGDVILTDEVITRLSADAFKHKWPDGLDLSDRLWKFEGNLKTGLTDVLKKGIKHSNSVNSVLYDMQREIEKAHGRTFKVVEKYQEDWVTRLHKAGQDLIHDPGSKKLWDKAVGDAEERIMGLSKNGTRTAAEQVLKEMRRAVEMGSEALLDKTAKWWMYDKQLYGIKRIVRTEMADALHNSVINSTIEDEVYIGYQWELSSSHPVTDICDYYANVDFGLGRGVWPKDKIPRNKAHPHCMCILTPRVTNVKQRGGKNFMDVIKKLPPAEVAKMLPKWALDKYTAGEDLTKYLRKDGAWLVTKEQAEKMAK